MDSKPQLSVGQRFAWVLVGDSSVHGQGIIEKIRTDRDEGLSPEAADYASLWIEARGISGTRGTETYTVMFSSDSKSYIDGKEITVSNPS